MSVQEARARWEAEKKLIRWLALGIGGVSLVGIVLAALIWRLSFPQTIGAMLIGAAGWQLIISAFEAAYERLKSADLPPFLRERSGWRSTSIVLLLFLLSFSAFGRIAGIFPPVVLGGLTLAALSAARRAQKLHRPRCFVGIQNDGRVLTLSKGALLLEALEEAGYKLMTQCGRRGRCSTCRVRVRRGPQEWPEAHYGPVMTPKQRHEGWVLACGLRVEEDLVIEFFKPLVIRWPQTRLSEGARRVLRALPGFDCEACGYPTCDGYARAIAQGEAPLTRCLPGGEAVRVRLQEIADQLKWTR